MSTLTKRERDRLHDARRRAQQPYRKLYKSARWLALRAVVLKEQPLCERCQAADPPRVREATTVHHKLKAETHPDLFFERSNLAASCAPCHNRVEQSIEALGYDATIGPDGWPIDPAHPGYQAPAE